MNYGCTPAGAVPLGASKGLDVTPATSLVRTPTQRVAILPGGGGRAVTIPARGARVVTVMPLPSQEPKK